MSSFKEAFVLLQTQLNTLVPTEFLYPVSLYPKHPDNVETDQEFPYFCMEYNGETPEYTESDTWWTTPSKETGSIRIWIAIQRSESAALSLDLIDKVKKVRDLITAVTSNRVTCDFRCRVEDVVPQYEPSGRWALAIITVVIGAYGK